MSDFTLLEWQVPEPPISRSWPDMLRWMVCVMDPSDARLAFIASCLSHSLRHDGLTKPQSEACNKILARIFDAYRDGILVCQNTMPTVRPGIQETLKE